MPSCVSQEIRTNPIVSHFEKLNDKACDIARTRCSRIKWGTDR